MIKPVHYSGLEMATKTAEARVLESGGTSVHTDIINSFTAALVTIIGGLKQALDTIHANTFLSGDGKQDAVIPAFVKSWNLVDSLAGSTLSGRDKVISDLEAQIVPRPYTGGNATIDECRAREIRDDLKSSLGDAVGRQRIRNIYMKSCGTEDADPELAHALETAPGRAYLTSTDIEVGRALRAKTENPGKVKDLDIFKVLREVLDYPLMYAKRIIKDLGMPVVNLDWGKIALEQDGNVKVIKLVSMRPYVMPDIIRKNITTADAAKKAGYHKEPWDSDDNALNLQ
jgi:hypothetical protein